MATNPTKLTFLENDQQLRDLVTDFENARTDAENFASATGSFTDSDGNTFQKGAKGWSTDAKNARDTAQNVRDDVVSRYGQEGGDPLYILADENGDAFYIIRKDGEIEVVGINKTIQEKLRYLDNLIGSFLRKEGGGDLYVLADENGETVFRIDVSGQLFLSELEQSVQAALGQDGTYNSDFIWNGQYHAQPQLNTNWRFWTFDSNEDLRVFDGDGTDFGTERSVSISSPTGTVRDPSVVYDNTRGEYLMAYTLGFSSESFIVAKSSDGLSWTNVKRIYPTDINPNLTTGNSVWAPEWFIYEDGRVRILVALDKSNQEIFAPTDSTLQTWTYEGRVTGSVVPSAIIDTFAVERNGAIYAVWKNETSDDLGLGISYNGLAGPYDIGESPLSFPTSANREGQIIKQLDADTWRLYTDEYSSDNMVYYETSDWQNWTAQTEVTISGSFSPRHGTILEGVPL